MPQLIRVDIDPYSFVDTVVFEVKSMLFFKQQLRAQTRLVFAKSTSEAIRPLPTVSRTVLCLLCRIWGRWRKCKSDRAVLCSRMCCLCAICPRWRDWASRKIPSFIFPNWYYWVSFNGGKIRRRAPTTRAVYHSSFEFAASVNQTDWQWHFNLSCLFICLFVYNHK